MRTTLILLTLLSIPATAQDVRIITDRFFWNNSDSPRSDIPYAQTGQQPARTWGSIFPPGDNGAGDVLCFEATNGADPVNDGCYTVVRAVFGANEGGAPYWIFRLAEDPPAWSLSSVEFQVTWDPIELFDDGFESGSTSSWSTTIGGRKF